MHISMSYVPSFDSMGFRFGLCAFILVYVPFLSVYVPLFWSMFLYFGLCSVIPFYSPLSISMSYRSIQCAIISFYGPSSCPMCHRFDLCAFVLFYVPSPNSMSRPSHPMCPHPILWTVIHHHHTNFKQKTHPNR